MRWDAVAQRAARRLGVEVTKAPSRESLTAHLRTALRGVDRVVDVGAHEGEWVAWLRRDVGWRGPIVSLEPSPDSVAELQRRAADDSSWTVLAIAAGAEPGTAELHRFPKGVLDSLQAPGPAGTAHYRKLRAPLPSVTVQVVRLSDVLAEHTAPDDMLLVKTDTQGHDLQVLDGLGNAWARVAAVLTEAAVQPLYADAPELPEIVTRLGAWGYTLAAVEPVSRDHFGRLVTVDCLFLRSAERPAG